MGITYASPNYISLSLSLSPPPWNRGIKILPGLSEPMHPEMGLESSCALKNGAERRVGVQLCGRLRGRLLGWRDLLQSSTAFRASERNTSPRRGWWIPEQRLFTSWPGFLCLAASKYARAGRRGVVLPTIAREQCRVGGGWRACGCCWRGPLGPRGDHQYAFARMVRSSTLKLRGRPIGLGYRCHFRKVGQQVV